MTDDSAEADAPIPVPSGDSAQCPTCHETVAPDDAFCESCGAVIDSGKALTPASAASPTSMTAEVIRPCQECGGEIDDSLFCVQCGTKARTRRDHFAVTPAGVAGVAGVCDRGLRHARNEDGMAVGVLPWSPASAVLVVCDGVTTAPRSDEVSLAAAERALQVLAARSSIAALQGAARITQWETAMRAACQEANAVAVAKARELGNPAEPPSSTYVAAVVDGDAVIAAWCGDSRAYWLPDGIEGVALTVDHSLGTEMTRSGVPPAQAEADPRSHTITRWLGADSADPTAEFVSMRLDSPGWVLVCSDGFWNYASSPNEARAVLDAAGNVTAEARAESMVRWANDQGGHDNITVCLARFDGTTRKNGPSETREGATV